MTAKITTPASVAPELKDFNPASLVYYNERHELSMDLDARLAWFYHLHKGWRITIDGVRLIGMEVYVNNDYTDEANPDVINSVREKETHFEAIGMVSMINEEGVRVATVPINTDALDPNFMGRLFEKGTFFLLDMNGINPYNISADQWAQLYKEQKNAEQRIQSLLRGDGPAVALSNNAKESAAAASKMFHVGDETSNTDEFFKDDSLFSTSAPIGLAPSPLIEEVILSDSYKIDDIKNLFRKSLDDKLQKECEDQNKFNEMFERYCIALVGDSPEEMQAEDKKTILDDLESKIARKRGKK